MWNHGLRREEKQEPEVSLSQKDGDESWEKLRWLEFVLLNTRKEGSTTESLGNLCKGLFRSLAMCG